MAPGPSTQQDDRSTGIYYSGATTSSTFYVFNSDSNCSYRTPPPTTFYELRMLQRELGRYLEDSYKELMRQLNMEPSAEGIRTMKRRLDLIITQVRSLWTRHVVFDLRQPCWRAGRWKSLTA